jgi:hypothetical protein
MTTLTATDRDVNSDTTDYDGAFVPSDADLSWAIEAFNLDTDATDYDDDEWAAAEAAAIDAHESGLLSPDLGESLSRGSLVGLRDEMAGIYADEAERISGRRPSRESAEHAMALAWFRLP